MSLTEQIAATAARLVVDDGMEYAAAKRKAVREVTGNAGARVELPSNEQLEDAVREHIAVFCADTQPAELRALREVALAWMQRLAEFRPHLSGAAWRGTATRLSALFIDLYCDDPKSAEIALINQRVNYDSGVLDAARNPRGGEPTPVLTVGARSAALGGEMVTVHLVLHDADAQRGALKPDAGGRSWRGDIAALERLLADDGAAP
jgi:hypothetical protein